LEAAGKPTVVVCNRRFAASGSATARMLGVAEYDLVTLPKLLISATDSEIEAIVEDALPGLMKGLLQQEGLD
jgi:hypothetical protein